MAQYTNALVVEGGGMRGIFSAGVLDAFLQHDFNPFHLHIGVSAGSTNLAAFLARMPGRNYKVFTDYSTRPEFISVARFLRGGHFIDLDWLWDITIREIRLDLDQVFNTPGSFIVGVTQVATGNPIYIQPNKDNLEQVIKASSAIPLLYRHFVDLEGFYYTDGGLADPIPVLEAYRRGAKQIMVLRSRPYDYQHKAGLTDKLSKAMLRKHPGLVKAFNNRAQAYNQAIQFIRNPPKGINILEVNPPAAMQSSRLSNDSVKLRADYEQALQAGVQAISQWQQKTTGA